MTKLSAIQGVLDGTYKSVRSTAFSSREYVFLDNSTLMFHSLSGNETYTNMSDLDDLSWSEYNNEWYNNIPLTGILVFDGSNNVKRAISYSSPNVTFDDGSTATYTDCSPLNQEEFETLYKTNKLYV